MAALDFPASPTDGDTFLSGEGVTYTWVDAKQYWKITAAGTIGPTGPDGPTGPTGPPGPTGPTGTIAGGYSASVVASLPGSPDANTIYFVTGA